MPRTCSVWSAAKIDARPAKIVARHVLEHAVAITRASRPKDSASGDFVKRYVAWGAGPRAAQHLVTAAKASAMLDGRPAPELRDLERMAVPVLRHRIIPNYNALGEAIEPEAIIKQVLETSGDAVAAR